MATQPTPHHQPHSIPSCALDGDGVRRQGQRLARLAPQVADAARAHRRLEVVFERGFDRAALEEALAVERECCPFFGLSFDEVARTLTVEVSSRDHEPAIDALAHQLELADR